MICKYIIASQAIYRFRLFACKPTNKAYNINSYVKPLSLRIYKGILSNMLLLFSYPAIRNCSNWSAFREKNLCMYSFQSPNTSFFYGILCSSCPRGVYKTEHLRFNSCLVHCFHNRVNILNCPCHRFV